MLLIGAAAVSPLPCVRVWLSWRWTMLGDAPLGAVTPGSGVLTSSAAVNGVNMQPSVENPPKVEEECGSNFSTNFIKVDPNTDKR